VQELDAVTVGQWYLSSAYRNGSTLQIDVEAAPGTGSNRLVLDRVTASLAGVPKTQCGPVDDRVLSSDPRSARVLPVGCTAWLFDDCKHCFGTAGHCSGSSLQVIQSNVPPSNSNGSLNNPPQQHQYSVDVSSKQSVNGGVGNDWGYFGVFPNSNTGLTAFQSQGQSYQLATPPSFNGSHQIRITGYGTDSSPLTSHQVQQTHSGPWAVFSGTALGYKTDTTGGNSGSPVIHEPTGNVIGVHTHGGCQTDGSGANRVTGANNGGWQAALASPLGICQSQASTSTY
jgi:V8-like Glu-specific endopeptidase